MAERKRLTEVERADGPTRRNAAPDRPRPAGAGLPALAQAAGNKAVTALVRGRGPTVQRHSSWEHALMGDTRPADLASATGKVAPGNRAHVLNQEIARVAFFAADPRAVPATAPPKLFDGIQVLKLAGSGLYVTYGEVNALADYLPNGSAINTMSAQDLIPILQHMRQVIATSAVTARDGAGADFDPGWAGAQEPSRGARAIGVASSDAKDLMTEDAATASRGFQRYTGLLSRNACHFAPMSWERWAQNHSQAVAEAQRAHGFRAANDTRAAGAETQAWVHNGYADHFLEDSFAAGHLINKTLVMQWFMEYAHSHAHDFGFTDLLTGPVVGGALDGIQMPDDDMVRAMGVSAQQHVGGQDLYQAMDSVSATTRGQPGPPMPTSTPTDPQTASEFRRPGLDATDRAALAGIRPVKGMSERQVAHQYQLFLSNAFLQKAAGEVHDHFNALTTGGLLVENGLGMRFRVGGDNTQLALSDPRGAQVPVEAVNLSRQVIADTIASGQSAVTGNDIMLLVPSKVVLGEEAYSLLTWNLTTVRGYCNKIFPEVFTSASANIVRMRGALPSTPNPDLAETR